MRVGVLLEVMLIGAGCSSGDRDCGGFNGYLEVHPPASDGAVACPEAGETHRDLLPEECRSFCASLIGVGYASVGDSCWAPVTFRTPADCVPRQVFCRAIQFECPV
jgi:hypothetical protein